MIVGIYFKLQFFRDLLSQMGTFLQIDTTEDDIYDETDDIDYEKDSVNEFETDHLNFTFAELKLMMTEMTDGIFKRVITPGSGEIVFSNAKVTLCYSAYWEKEKTPFDSTFLRGPNEVFNTKAQFVLQINVYTFAQVHIYSIFRHLFLVKICCRGLL